MNNYVVRIASALMGLEVLASIVAGLIGSGAAKSFVGGSLWMIPILFPFAVLTAYITRPKK